MSETSPTITHLDHGDRVDYPDGRSAYYPGGLTIRQWRKIQAEHAEAETHRPRRTAYDGLLPEGAVFDPPVAQSRFTRAERRRRAALRNQEHIA